MHPTTQALIDSIRDERVSGEDIARCPDGEGCYLTEPDGSMARTGRTTRMVAEAVAAATAGGTVYVVAATAADARRIAGLVADAVIQAGHTPCLDDTNVRWSGRHVRVVTLAYRWLDTRAARWAIVGTHDHVFVDHYARYARHARSERSARSDEVLREAIRIAEGPDRGLVAAYVVAAHEMHAAYLRGRLVDLGGGRLPIVVVTPARASDPSIAEDGAAVLYAGTLSYDPAEWWGRLERAWTERHRSGPCGRPGCVCCHIP